ncbi:MAG: hypothetical protein CBARDCOR_6533 [uncultured Caballeronia sp.]|nr:MAG: hypothetical protein CBARDCOR_6533 [uncultured Caballeronia sp.]
MCVRIPDAHHVSPGSAIRALGPSSPQPGLTAALQRLYGDAGGGWCGLSYTTSSDRRGGSANPDRLFQSGTDDWSTSKNDHPVVDLCTSVSGTPGDIIHVTNTSGPTSDVRLHYVPGGSIDYRWNEGSWRRLDLFVAGHVMELTGFPSVGAWMLDIKVASGVVELAGIEHRNDNPGIRIHNLGAEGSTALDWSSVDAATWQACIAALDLHTALTFFGTNDQKRITPQEYGSSLARLEHSLRAAAPHVDIALGTSPESDDLTEPRPGRPMRLYMAETRQLAIDQALCHIDCQPAFGDYSGLRPLLDDSLIHPSVAGMHVIESLYLRVLGTVNDQAVAPA